MRSLHKSFTLSYWWECNEAVQPIKLLLLQRTYVQLNFSQCAQSGDLWHRWVAWWQRTWPRRLFALKIAPRSWADIFHLRVPLLLGRLKADKCPPLARRVGLYRQESLSRELTCVLQWACKKVPARGKSPAGLILAKWVLKAKSLIEGHLKS